MARSGLKGVGDLRRRLRKLPRGMTTELRAVFTSEAPAWEAEMEARAPKHLGRLSAAATAQVSRDELAMYAGYSKKRAGFKRQWKRGGFVSLWQEFRTKQAPAQPFIRPTYEARKDRALARIRAALRGVLEKVRGT